MPSSAFLLAVRVPKIILRKKWKLFGNPKKTVPAFSNLKNSESNLQRHPMQLAKVSDHFERR
jgi:hypothetical protein